MQVKYLYLFLLVGCIADVEGQLLRHNWSNHLVNSPYMSSDQTALHQTYIEKDELGDIIGLGIYPADYATFSFDDFDECAGRFFLKKSNADGELKWIKEIGAEGLAVNIRVFNLKLDAQGDIYVLGEFKGTMDLDPGAGEELIGDPAENDRMLFVAKYNPEGEFLWSFSKHSNNSIYFTDMDLNPLDNSVTVIGNYRSTFTIGLDFNPGGSAGSLPQLGGFVSTYILSISSAGDFNWIKGFGAYQGETYFSSILHDDQGQIILSGFTDTAFEIGDGIAGEDGIISQFIVQTFDGDNGNIWYDFPYSEDYFMFNFLSRDNLIEETQLIRNGDEIWLFGYFLDELSIGNDFIANTTGQEYSRYLFRLENFSQGPLLIEIPIKEGAFSLPLDRIIGNDDDMLVLTGIYSETQDFDWTLGGTRFMSTTAIYTPYMLGISSEGEFVFADQIDGNHSAHLYDIIHVGQNNFVLSGSFKGDIDMAINLDTIIPYSSGAYDGLEFKVTVALLKAVCKDTLEVNVDVDGSFDLSPEMLDDGSYANYESDLFMSLDQVDFDCQSLSDDQNLTLTVEDLFSGDSDSCETYIIPVDPLAPTALCQDLSLDLSSDTSIQIDLEDIDAGSYDNCLVDTLFISQQYFDCSDVGANAVVLTITDAGGLSSTCEAQVNILDNIAPDIDCSDTNVYLDENGEVQQEDLLEGLMMEDNCGIANQELLFDVDVCNPGSVDEQAEFMATDYSGNTSLCSFKVLIIDDIKPIVSCRELSFILAGEEDEIQLTEEQIVAELWDNCSVEELSFSPLALDIDDLGENTILLEVTDSYGNLSSCTASVFLSIRVAPDELVYIPNVFSPNNDGVNDYLAIYSNKRVMQIEHFMIRDRWGNIHFEQKDMEPVNSGLGWNGQMNGEQSPKGVYFYDLSVLAIDGEYYSFYGTVNLL